MRRYAVIALLVVSICGMAVLFLAESVAAPGKKNDVKMLLKGLPQGKTALYVFFPTEAFSSIVPHVDLRRDRWLFIPFSRTIDDPDLFGQFSPLYLVLPRDLNPADSPFTGWKAKKLRDNTLFSLYELSPAHNDFISLFKKMKVGSLYSGKQKNDSFRYGNKPWDMFEIKEVEIGPVTTKCITFHAEPDVPAVFSLPVPPSDAEFFVYRLAMQNSGDFSDTYFLVITVKYGDKTEGKTYSYTVPGETLHSFKSFSVPVKNATELTVSLQATKNAKHHLCFVGGFYQ